MSTQISRVPVAAKRDRRISRNDWQVLVALGSYARAEGQAWPSSLRLSNDTGLERRAVRRCLDRLQQLGYLRAVGRLPNKHGGLGAIQWQLCSPGTDGAVDVPTAGGTTTAPTADGTNGAPRMAQNCPTDGTATAPRTDTRTDTQKGEALLPWNDAPELQRAAVARLIASELARGAAPEIVVQASRELREDCRRKGTLQPSRQAWEIALGSARDRFGRLQAEQQEAAEARVQATERLRPTYGDDAERRAAIVAERFGVGALLSTMLHDLAGDVGGPM